MITRVLANCLARAPGGDVSLAHKCQRYVDHANGEGNDERTTNGEQWLAQRIAPGARVVFDVGANRGDWAALWLAANPQALIHCFEPYPPTFRELVARGLPANVQCNPLGLSATRRTAALFIFDAAPALNSLYRRRGLEGGWGLEPPDREEPIQLRCLDEYCDEHDVKVIDYLKLDVEGHELDVLNGGAGLFEQGRVKCGQFEYGGCNIDSRVLLQDFFKWFDGVGYSLYKLLPDRLLPVARYDQRHENFRYQNWVFARRDLAMPQ
jgi:FkbM family methyltransferase